MNLSEKNKLYLLLAGLVLMLVISYKVAIKSTLDVRAKYRDLKEKSLIAEELPVHISRCQEQLDKINNSYFDALNGMDDTHEIFLERLGKIAFENKSSITEFPEKHTYKSSSVEIETHTAVLKGRFANLLKILYQLEVHERIGRLVSVDFFMETNRRTKKESLSMRLYIQNYRNNTNDEKPK